MDQMAGESTFRHEPVLAHEVLAELELSSGQVVFDGTLGLGGHANLMAERIAPGGTLVGTDWDESMLGQARSNLKAIEGVDLRLFHADFRELPEIAERERLRAHGILLDLGLNSAQVDDPDRGFSFSKDGALDMRMDRSVGEPASAIVNRMTPAQLEQMLQELGDERWARAIAKQIVDRRKARPIRTTGDLVECVLSAIPPAAREKRIHPATRTFQALRIYVNGELDGLESALRELAERLAPGGTLAVISFHSGEDRIVKRVFRELDGSGFEERHRKPIEASESEVRRNPRSRSAKLRTLRRTPNMPPSA